MDDGYACARLLGERLSYCYPSCKHSHSAISHYALPEMLDVFSLSVGVEMPVAPSLVALLPVL